MFRKHEGMAFFFMMVRDNLKLVALPSMAIFINYSMANTYYIFTR